jgi:hypothetical protein
MSKVIFNRGRNPEERKLIPDRTKEIAEELRRQTGGDFLRIKDIMAYLQCGRTAVYKYLGDDRVHNLKRVKHTCGTKMFRAEDIAKRLAEREALCG